MLTPISYRDAPYFPTIIIFITIISIIPPISSAPIMIDPMDGTAYSPKFSVMGHRCGNQPLGKDPDSQMDEWTSSSFLLQALFIAPS